MSNVLDGPPANAHSLPYVDLDENAVLRFARRRFRVTDTYHGNQLTAVVDGRRAVTPVFLVLIAIGTTDLLFALDSIPATFGVTQEPYLVFTWTNGLTAKGTLEHGSSRWCCGEGSVGCWGWTRTRNSTARW